jgi:catechol 2,3-dioxygenase-like lactoylglutathione lyase family enzyme
MALAKTNKIILMIDFIRADHFHICVPAERLEEARRFYTDVVGLKEKFRPDVFGAKGYWFDIGNVELHIGIEPTLPRSIRHTAIEVKDVEAAKAHLKKHGVEISEEAMIPGRDRFSFFDPFGNRMELLSYLS